MPSANPEAANPVRLAEITAEVESAPAPVGVDAGTWEELKAALLATISSRWAALAPEGEQNRVQDLVLAEQQGEGWQLSWSYLNTGDYDLNSEVSITDLTPVGRNFGATPLCGYWDTARLADGDGNGEVNISDVTPIGQNFNARIGGFEIHGANSTHGPWTLIDTIALDAPPDEAYIPITYELAGRDYEYYQIIPVDDALEPGEPSDPSLTALQPPQINLGSSTDVAVHTVTHYGGSLLGTGVLDGYMISFPEDAVGNDVEVSLGYYDGTVVPNSSTVEGPIIDLRVEPEFVFNEPVIITAPFTAGNQVVPIMYDIAEDGSLAPLLLEDVDFEAGLVKFLTWHCSPKVLLKGKADALTADQFTSMGRKFNPAKDGFQITNAGSR